MLIYSVTNLTILILAIFCYGTKTIKLGKKELGSLLFISLTFLLLFIISGFRGNFTSDYDNYISLFEYYNQFTFLEIFKVNFGQEFGYVFLNRIIGIFTKNGIYSIILSELLILSLFYKELKKESPCFWLSILMFVTIGSFYTSFNITRQIIAVAFIFIGSKYLYNRNFIKYCLIVIIAALFHKTAIIMIPFYFILNYKFNLKQILIIIIAAVGIGFYLEEIVEIVRVFFYSTYEIGTYGMTGFSFMNVVLPISLLCFILINYNKLDFKEIKENIWMNAVVFYVFFSILGLKFMMVQRIAEFFAPYVLLIIPKIISEIKGKDIRNLYFLCSIVLLLAYNYIVLSGSGYDPYYFIWQI